MLRLWARDFHDVARRPRGSDPVTRRRLGGLNSPPAAVSASRSRFFGILFGAGAPGLKMGIPYPDFLGANDGDLPNSLGAIGGVRPPVDWATRRFA